MRSRLLYGTQAWYMKRKYYHLLSYRIQTPIHQDRHSTHNKKKTVSEMLSEANILKYRNIPKISPGAHIFQRPFLKGLFFEGLIYGGKFAFQIDWASLIVGSKFTVFALFYFVFEGIFPSTSPRGTYIWRCDLTEGFLRYRFGGFIFGGAYFRNFTVYWSCLPLSKYYANNEDVVYKV